ncbi:MAG: NAD(P)/FAD-dependent oxidoreductase [Candidatus Bathyarchaeia archaeon]
MVGAGPAGSAAARKAAQLGLNTLLLEKEKMPRDKLCGGGVTPKVLQLLDFQLPNEIIECAPKATRIHVGQNCFTFQTSHPLVYMTSRSKFDNLLFQKAAEAGAEVRDGTPVRSVEAHPEYSEVRTPNGSFQSKMVIGADGMGGPTARSGHLYQSWDPYQVAYAIETEVRVGRDSVLDFIGPEEYFDIYFGVSQAGYGWIFPKDDHLTVGVGCRLSKVRDAQELFGNFVKGIPELQGRAIPKPKAHLIPLGGIAKVPIAADRILLAGDSAGFAEPLLGEGIYFAVLGGQIAAEVALAGCSACRFDQDFLSSYTRRCHKEFGRDFDVAYRVACFSYLEQYDMDRVARFFFSEKKVQECMVGLMEGTMRYRDVQAKLAWQFLKYQVAKLGLLPFYS